MLLTKIYYCVWWLLFPPTKQNPYSLLLGSVTDIYGIEGPGGFSRRAVDGRGPPGKLRLCSVCWSSSDGALQQIGLISYLNLEI